MLAEKDQGSEPDGLTSVRLRRRPVLCLVLGGVLLMAAGVKVWGSYVGPPLEGEGWGRGEVAHVQWEVFLGTWLLLGSYNRGLWWAAFSCFTLYAGVAGYKLHSGVSSCGCLGWVPLHPGVSLGFDAFAVGALLCQRGAILQRASWSASCSQTLTACVIAALTAGLLSWIGISRWETMGEIRAMPEGSVVLLRPKEWVGKPCPILDFVDPGDALRTGRWRVVFYYADCERCQCYLDNLRRHRPVERSLRLCLVEVPHGLGPMPSMPPLGVQVARLNRVRKWIVERRRKSSYRTG